MAGYLGTALVLLTCCTVFITVSGQDVQFLKEPADVTFIGGQNIELECQILNPPGAVQWTRGGFGLGSDRDLSGYNRYKMVGSVENGEYNLLIANAQLIDDDEFQCQIGPATDFRGLTSRTAKVTVLWPPSLPVIENSVEIETNKWQLKVTANQKINITCLAQNGKPAADITWAVNGQEVTQNTYYSVADTPGGLKQQDATGYLELTPTLGDQGHRVECYANNSALRNPILARTYLEVLYPPEISMVAEPSRKVREGGAGRFTCQGEANPNEITWKWFLGEVELSGQTSNVLTLYDMGRDKHGQKVACEGTNSVGSTRHEYNLNIEYGPRFTAEPSHVAADLEDVATLTCKVDGNPAPAIIWTKQGSLRMLGNSDTLTFSAVSDADFGVYICTATVIGFKEIRQDIHLMRNGPPSIISEAEQYAVYNDNADIVCTANAVPKPTEVLWEKDGHPVDVEGNIRYTLKPLETLDVIFSRSAIAIRKVQDQDYGTYNCTVINERGSDSITIQFIKKETIPVWVIALCVILGFLIVVGIGVGLFFWYRKKRGGSEYGSDSSENTLQKKEDKQPEIPIQYKDNTFKSPLDGWGDNKYSGGDYDELNNYGAKQTNQGLDTRDGLPGYQQRSNDYGTYPGPAHGIYNTRYAASDYGPATNYSDYGTYGRMRQPPYASSDYGVPPTNHYGPPPTQPASSPYPPPPASMDSRLATNV